jgi:alpha-ribazole phosphatase
MEEIKNIDAENILLITHGGVIRSIYSYILGENLDLYWKFASRNADISIIKYEYGNYFIDCIVPTKE